MSKSPLPQARGIHEGERSRGARDAHALAPRKGEPIRFHAVAEEDEGFGADDEAQLFILVQDALGVLDAGRGRARPRAQTMRVRARSGRASPPSHAHA